MKLYINKAFAVLGLGLVMSTVSFATYAQGGFSGDFAPENWTMGENPGGHNLIDTSSAPGIITISNYKAWQSSGAAMTYEKAHGWGKITFSYTVQGGPIDQCPPSYFVGDNTTVLGRSGTDITFNVAANQPFGFALNGSHTANDFACKGTLGHQIDYQIYSFSFTPTRKPITPSVNSLTSPTTNTLNSIARNSSGRYVAVGNSGVSIYSDDGVNWNANTALSSTLNLIGVASSGSTFAAVGQDIKPLDNLFWSSNGINWKGSYSSPGWSAVTYPTAGTGNFYIAVGGTSIWNPQSKKQVYTGYTIERGTNSLNQWLPKPVINNTSLSAIAWHESTVVAVGMTIISANDTTFEWAPRTKPVTYPLKDVAWGASTFISVGVGGGIATSPDGTTWTARTSGTNETLTGIACSGGDNNWCVAVGSGILLTTTDGITWTSHSTLAANKGFVDVVWTGAGFIAVGTGGNIWNITDSDS
jgi:hypothetical protein